jgi:hypothetical protein
MVDVIGYAPLFVTTGIAAAICALVLWLALPSFQVHNNP